MAWFAIFMYFQYTTGKDHYFPFIIYQSMLMKYYLFDDKDRSLRLITGR